MGASEAKILASAENEKEVRSVFNKFDKDKNGTLDQGEWRAVARLLAHKKDKFPTLREFTDDELNELFHTVAHGKTTIHFDEFLAFFRVGVEGVSPRPRCDSGSLTSPRARGDSSGRSPRGPNNSSNAHEGVSPRPRLSTDISITRESGSCTTATVAHSTSEAQSLSPRSARSVKSLEDGSPNEQSSPTSPRGSVSDTSEPRDAICARTMSSIVRENVTNLFEDKENWDTLKLSDEKIQELVNLEFQLFDEEELPKLYTFFLTMAKPHPKNIGVLAVLLPDLERIFPLFAGTKLLKRFVNVFNIDQSDDCLPFDEFIVLASITCRGSVQHKANLMSRLVVSKKERVYRKQLIKRSKEIRKHLLKSGKEVQLLNDVPLEELVNSVFRANVEAPNNDPPVSPRNRSDASSDASSNANTNLSTSTKSPRRRANLSESAKRNENVMSSSASGGRSPRKLSNVPIPISIVSPDGSALAQPSPTSNTNDTEGNDDDSDDEEKERSRERTWESANDKKEVDEMMLYLETHGNDRWDSSSDDCASEGEEDNEEEIESEAKPTTLNVVGSDPFADATTNSDVSLSKLYTNKKNYTVPPFEMTELETKLALLVDQSASSMAETSAETSSAAGQSNPLDHLENYLSVEEFRRRAVRDEFVANYFGMFLYIRFHLRRKFFLSEATAPPIAALSGEIVVNGSMHTCDLRGPFLNVYKKSDTTKLSRVINIQQCTLSLKKDLIYLEDNNKGGDSFTLLFHNKTERRQWIDTLRNLNISSTNLFGASTPPRISNAAQWFICGSSYFEAVCDALLQAKRRILITGWFFAPGLYLKRKLSYFTSTNGSSAISNLGAAIGGSGGEPIDHEAMKPTVRIDKILEKKAKEGVEIFIMIWNNIETAFAIQSEWVKKNLPQIHPLIQVKTHPIAGTAEKLSCVWSHHQKTVTIDEKITFVGGIDLGYGRYDDTSYSLTDVNGYVYPGRDYQNFSRGPTENSGPTMKEVIDRKKMVRMPWQDIHCYVSGSAAEDVAKNFVERWNYICMEEGASDHIMTLLRPEERQNPVLDSTQLHKNSYGDCTVQVLRSVGLWNVGFKTPEKSIYNAYISLIKSAKKYIYIENQFFVSSISNSAPCNRISEALLHRLKSAIRHHEDFRVYMVLPVHSSGNIQETPTRWTSKYVVSAVRSLQKSLRNMLLKEKLLHLPAELGDSSDLTPRGTHVHKSKRERVEELKKHIHESVNDYFRVYSLRSIGALDGVVQTEQIYVHSKLMIVDDAHVIIGSANINDRSMLGDRDSEICVHVTQPEEASVPVKMGRDEVLVSPFARNLRLALWSLFLGFPQDSDVFLDPTSDFCWNTWSKVAEDNTNKFVKIFTLIPNNMHSVRAVKKSLKKKPTITPDQLDLPENKIQGHLTQFPINFLRHDLIYVDVDLPNILNVRTIFI